MKKKLKLSPWFTGASPVRDGLYKCKCCGHLFLWRKCHWYYYPERYGYEIVANIITWRGVLK